MSETTSDVGAATRLRVATIMGRTRVERCGGCAGSGLRWSGGAVWRCRECPQDMSRLSDEVGTGLVEVADVSYTVDDMIGWLRGQGHTVEDIYADGEMFSFLLGDVLGGVRSTSFVGLLEAAVVAVGTGEPAPSPAPAPAPDVAATDPMVARLLAHSERLVDVLLGVRVDHLDEPKVAAAVTAHAALLRELRR